MNDIEPARHYGPGDSPAAKLETEMWSRGVYHVGNPDDWTKRVNKKGEERYAGLDMSPSSRAYRTLDIKKLTREEVSRLHQHELDCMTRFVIGPSEMRRILNNLKIDDQFFLQPDQVAEVVEFNNNHRPVADRYLLGMPIPPYFAHDYDFDGMIYHHAWDKCVWAATLDAPQPRGKKSQASGWDV